MGVKRCKVCGKLIKGRRSDAIYCSEECAKSIGRKKTDPTMECPHRTWVQCNARQCHICGFYPPVESARKKALEERYGTG
jgi:hypothetical protein